MTPLNHGHFRLEQHAPSLEEYRSLCCAVGWDEAVNFDAAAKSLDRSLFAVTAIATAAHPEDEHVVGMGRIVGDGAIYFYIQDIAVRPEWQGTGIGRAIVEELMAWLYDHAPERAFVGLFAAGGREGFYAHYGFMRHPSLTGMFTVIPAPQPAEQWA